MPRPLAFRRHSPLLLLTLPILFVAIAIAVVVAGWYSLALTPLERQYLPAYIACAMDGGSSRLVPIAFVDKTGPRRKPELADDADVVARLDAALPLALSPAARAAGWSGLAVEPRELDRRTELKEFLEARFYGGNSLGRLLLRPALGTAVLLVLLFAARGWFGSRSRHEERHGRRMRGPELASALVPALGWKRGARGGIRLRLRSRLGLPVSFRIPQRLESSHILLMGDTGSGKSNAIRQILKQVERRSESAIVYDPAMEFAAQFYRPERGDLILNPFDARCPSWNLATELLYGGVAETIAAAMLPERDFENRFFTDAPRRVLARLLRSRPSVAQLLEWMADPAEIERRLERTPEAILLDRAAGPQRAGVLSSLNLIADSLALLPETSDRREAFATERWGFARTRWVFLTSQPATRERVLPLHSAWLDLLILQMMQPCANEALPVWFVLDELASLNRLPQLHTAVTESRKHGNPVVLGFQGRSQLEKRYGQDAEAMLSQPATKIFFKTSEPRAAKWISETLGEVEVERMRESRSHQLLRGITKQFSMEIATKPLVMPSEIAGLEPLHGYVKIENRVTPVRFRWMKKRVRQPGFISRAEPAPEPRPVVQVPEPSDAAAPAFQPVAAVKPTPAAPKPTFGRKPGSATQKPREWDQSQWID